MWRLAIAIMLTLGGSIELARAQITPDRVHGRVGVVDGDTIEIGGMRIRLHGIDENIHRYNDEVSTEEYWRMRRK